MSQKLTKHLLYAELLEPILPLLRNRETWPFWKRIRPLHAETELIHNVYVTLGDPDFSAWDVWFLNHNARYYVEHGQDSLLYQRQVEAIRRLFAAIPKELRSELTWDGP